jgi:uncharacterized protein involved in outer membrane biogenesis
VSRVFTWVLRSAALLAAVLVVAASALVFWVDPGVFRGELEARAAATFGRTVTLAGPIRLRPSLRPSLVVEDVRFGNPAWASRPYIAQARKLAVQVALRPLLRGELEILDVSLDGVDVLLESGPEGATNFRSGGAGKPAVLPGVAHLRVTESTFAVRSANGHVVRCEIGEATLRSVAGGPTEVEFRGSYNTEPIEVRYRGEPSREVLGSQTPWRIELTAQASNLSLGIQGRVTGPADWSEAEYEARVQGTGTEALAALFGTRLPQLGAYELSARVRAGEGLHAVSGIRGKIRGAGGAHELVIAGGEGSGARRQPIQLRLQGTYADNPFTIDLAGGDYDTLADPSTPWPLQLRARVAGASLELDASLNRTPAGGALTAWAAVRGGSLAALAAVIGVERAPVVPFDLSARIEIAHGVLAARDLAGRIAATEVGGEIEWMQGARPRIGGRLELGEVDLAALLAAHRGAADSEGPRPSGHSIPTAWLGALEGDLDLRVRRISGGPVLIERVATHAKLEDGQLTLSPLALAVAGMDLAGTVEFSADDEDALIRIRCRGKDLDIGEATLRSAAWGPTEVEVRGSYRNVPLEVRYRGEPLHEVAGTQRPWSMELTAQASNLSLGIEGRVGSPADWSEAEFEVRVRGAGTEALTAMLDTRLPSLGEFELSAQVRAGGGLHAVSEVRGRIRGTGGGHELVIAGGEGSGARRQPIQLHLRGSYADSPFTLDLAGGDYDTLFGLSESWPLQLRTRLSGADLEFDGSLTGPPAGAALTARAEVRGDSLAALAGVAGVEHAPAVPFDLSARIQVSRGTLAARDLAGHVANTEIGGEIEWAQGARPRLGGRLELGEVDLAALRAATPSTGQAGGPQPLDLPIPTAWLGAFDADLDLRVRGVSGGPAPIARVATHAKLEARQLTLSPLALALAGVDLAGTAEFSAQGEDALLSIQGRGKDVDVGKVLVALGREQTAGGRLEGLELSLTARGRTPRSWLELAALEVKTGPGRLVFGVGSSTRPTEVRLATVSVEAQAGGPVRLTTGAELRTLPFTLMLEGPTLRGFLLDAPPWPIEVEAQAAQATLSARGSLGGPPAQARLSLDYSLQGEDFSDLGPLLEFVLPLDGPFHFSGRVEAFPNRWDWTRILGTIGKSDIGGTLSLFVAGARPRIVADLVSQRLYLPDVGSRDEEDAQPQGRLLIPDYSFPVDVLRAIDIELALRAEDLVLKTQGLGKLRFKVTHKDGRFAVSEFSGTGRGGARIEGNLELNAALDPPTGSFRLAVRSLDYGLLLRDLGVVEQAEGLMDLDVALSGSGASRRDFLEHARGRLVLTSGQGKIASRALEVWATGLIKTMLSPLWRRESVTEIECLVLGAEVVDGIAKTDELLIDSRRMTVGGSGTLKLATEEIDLLLVPSPRESSLVSLAHPVHILGPLSGPSYSVATLPSRKKLAVTGLLAGLVNPAFLVFTFSELGTDGGNRCAAAVAKAKREAE